MNNFYWLFSLDLKSSNKSVQMVIKNWIDKNYKYNSKNWNFEITSKRIISWLSNTLLLTIMVLINIKKILTQLYINKHFT